MDSTLLKLLLIGTLVVLLQSEEENVFVNRVKKQNSICDLSLALGDCQFNITRFYYDKNTNQCYKFLYSGCKGNGNRFISDKQCRQRCHQETKRNYNAVLNDLIEPYKSSFNLTCENCHTINGICVDNKCQCRMGYQLIDYKCLDVNECLWTACGKNAVCVNSLGSFRCECLLGYAGSGLNCSRSQDICGQTFDKRYEENCNNTDPSWQLRYFYNYTSNQCQQFRYGGCQFEGAQNIFRDLQACQTHCHGFHYLYETKSKANKPKYDYSYTTESTIPDLCFDTFDQTKRFPCTEGIWKKRYFFDKSSMRCSMFWYDESCDQKPRATSSRNIFVHERTCVEVCELTAGRMLESQKQGISGVIHAIFDHDWDGAKIIRDRLLTTPSPSSTTTITTTVETSTVPLLTTQHGIQLFENVITPLPLPETPSPFTAIEVKLEEAESMLIHQNIINEDKENEILIIKNLNETFDEKANYSLAVNLPVTTAEECLDKFDQNLAHSCQQIPNWKTRYYFDSTSRTCKAYWFGGCWSHSRNNFESLETCKWKCIGEHYEPISHSCLDKFDKKYLEDCRNGVYEIRYFFNHNTKRCESLYFGGCQSQSRNFFADLGQCQQHCETVPKDLSNFCLQSFDPVYRNSCTSDGSWSQYYYYDSAADSCKMFWYGNCKSNSQNIFATLESCEWLCERNRESKVPQHCLDKFDHRYRNPCNGGKWQERYYFDHTTGRCRAFWYDGCIAESQNIFKSRESCIGLCEAPSITAATTVTPKSSTLPQIEAKCEPTRCLKPLLVGDCKETLPAYYYNIEKRICEPFSYSGCGGNENRFLTLSQCDQTCGNLKALDAIETNCFLPLSIGYGRKRKSCIKNAGFAFYYNSKEKRCGRFWYLGCGGNGNRFSHASECARVCRRSHSIPIKAEPLKPVSACFLEIDNGKCENSRISNNLTRWGYVSGTGKCEKFEYAGCEGNDNRFSTQHECLKLCQNLVAPNSMQCAHYPDWGPCNRLRYVWFYNLTSGTCQQFLYGGCNGNENRFPTFELCQITCEKPGEAPSDPCAEKLDRGKWCESMSNRYYYHAKSKTCKGFHYTGCGQSRNNFLQLDECENACVHRKKDFIPAVVAAESKSTNVTGTKYASKKPSENKPMQRHQILTESEKHYLKTEGQWVEYGHCLGFRYNISGPHTKLNSFICLMEEGGTCQIQTLTDTGGEERCRVIRPWLRGSHLYSWFFTIERRKAPWHTTPEELSEDKKSKRNAVKLKPQKASDTVASLIILPLNDCYNIC